MEVIIREASEEDWNSLLKFYTKIYRKNHPLQNLEFWKWQFGNEKNGKAFICTDLKGEIVAHVGGSFEGGFSWMINGYVHENYRGRGLMPKMYNLARKYYPLAATAVSFLGLRMYRNMRWIRYADLARYVKVNPNLKNKGFKNVCRPIKVDIEPIRITNTHYFKQPKIKGIQLKGNSTGVSQEEVGGFRVVDLGNISDLEKHAWSLGYLWIDYVTSWNDIKIKKLEKCDWDLDYKNVVPWRLNPVEENYFCDITFLSEKPLDNEFIVHRSFSDHGRIGSI